MSRVNRSRNCKSIGVQHCAIATHLEAIDDEMFWLRGVVERIDAALVPRAS